MVLSNDPSEAFSLSSVLRASRSTESSSAAASEASGHIFGKWKFWQPDSNWTIGMPTQSFTMWGHWYDVFST